MKKNKDPLELIVSLPANDPQLAMAAVKAGASALKVHINVEHRASGSRFGSFHEERQKLSAILEVAEDIPVGIMPGAETVCTVEELHLLADLGFTFFDVYIQHAPSWMLSFNKMTKFMAIDHTYSLEQITLLSELKLTGTKDRTIDWLEASIIPPDGYGKPLTVQDIINYGIVSSASAVPVLVPSQRAITAEDVFALANVGVQGIMIGAIVTSNEPGKLRLETMRFRQAIDSL